MAAMNLNRFDLATLRLYVAAIDTGSLTAGAERMGISLAACGLAWTWLPVIGVPLPALLSENSKLAVVPSADTVTLSVTTALPAFLKVSVIVRASTTTESVMTGFDGLEMSSAYSRSPIVVR